MGIDITNTYNSYASQIMAENNTPRGTKKKEAEKSSPTAKNDMDESMADYVRQLAKLVPSVEFRVGNSFSSAKTGLTLAVNPKLNEKMRNNPEQEKETKELIRGVETMTKWVESLNKATGWKTVFRHSYIDENGKYYSCSLTVNEFGYKMSEKLRKERQENAKKLIEKTREKTAERKNNQKEKIEETKAEKKKTEKAPEQSAKDKAIHLLNQKMNASPDGIIYMNHTDMLTILEAAKADSEGQTAENHAGKPGTKPQAAAGANLDLQV